MATSDTTTRRRASGARVTIGLPTFNGERYLAAAVSSLLAQDFGDLEVVIADNASTDGTRDICHDFVARDERVRYLPAETNRGAAWNFNRLVAEAGGEFFKWAADDDLYAPGFVGACVKELEADDSVVLAYTQATEIDSDGEVIELRGPTNVADVAAGPARYRAVLMDEVYCYSVFGVIRAEALRRTGLIGAFAQSDRVLLAELALRGRFVERAEPWFLHREHPGRSMYAYTDDRDRLRWFDTSRDGSLSLPRWRLGAEHARALAGRGDGVGVGTRLRSAMQLLPWGVANRGVLSRELAKTVLVRSKQMLPVGD